MAEAKDNWCLLDHHHHFELFEDFNSWIDEGESEQASKILEDLGIGNLSSPSKAFYAGDKAAYEQVLAAFRLENRNGALSKNYFLASLGVEDGTHWFERNEQRFDQLVERISEDLVVPFIGAGVSVAGGFPTWANHLRQQGRTAGIPHEQIEKWLAHGQYEQIIQHIEETHGADAFAQEIRDVFSKTGKVESITLRISELFKDTLITTNYDRLLEHVFETGAESSIQVINGMSEMEPLDPKKVTIIKLHGDIKSPRKCILGKSQYDQAYGEQALDFDRPIPKRLRYYFRNSSLLFVGCSLHNDRTVQVFNEVKSFSGDVDFPQHFAIEQAPELVADLIRRNSELSRLGVTALWYPKGEYEKVEAILRLAKNELNFRRTNIGTSQ